MSKKIRTQKPERWKICTEGETESIYLQAYIKALGIDDFVDVNCPAQTGKGCGRKHLSLLQAMQGCGRRWRYNRVFLVHDYDDAAEDKIARKGFNETFDRARDETDDVYVIYSNPCFEYFLMLHTGDYQQNWNRSVYQKRVKDYCRTKLIEMGKPIPLDYEYKTDPDLFTYFGGLEGAKKACAFARKRFDAFEPSAKNFSNAGFASKAPCTNVFELLEELNQILIPK